VIEKEEKRKYAKLFFACATTVLKEKRIGQFTETKIFLGLIVLLAKFCKDDWQCVDEAIQLCSDNFGFLVPSNKLFTKSYVKLLTFGKEDELINPIPVHFTHIQHAVHDMKVFFTEILQLKGGKPTLRLRAHNHEDFVGGQYLWFGTVPNRDLLPTAFKSSLLEDYSRYGNIIIEVDFNSLVKKLEVKSSDFRCLATRKYKAEISKSICIPCDVDLEEEIYSKPNHLRSTKTGWLWTISQHKKEWDHPEIMICWSKNAESPYLEIPLEKNYPLNIKIVGHEFCVKEQTNKVAECAKIDCDAAMDEFKSKIKEWCTNNNFQLETLIPFCSDNLRQHLLQ
jgi:hypothetical protein